MTSQTLTKQAERFTKKVPEILPGYTVRVHEKIQEGSKERVQVFEGLVISVHNGHTPTDRSFTVRKVVSGIGVEKTFPLMSPSIEKIEVKKVAKTRRAKLFFIRGRTGKAARFTERFTTEGEFAVPGDGAPAAEATEADIVTEVAAPAEEAAVEQAPAVEAAPEAPKDEQAAA